MLVDELIVEFRLLFEFVGLGDAGGEHLGDDVFVLLFHLFEESVMSLFQLFLLFFSEHPQLLI